MRKTGGFFYFRENEMASLLPYGEQVSKKPFHKSFHLLSKKKNQEIDNNFWLLSVLMVGKVVLIGVSINTIN